ncbi:hypothetical protein PDESU_06193 [Pontiella desulfatans]|uniref:NrS-1 polymerase-like helicase domain-containing protein n=1 Tax=Pontiella desulfatans TaxID=2750659 RepID=A0A6C2UC07_PONDE|nr:DUF5906 domain-containing protein [Pontiella desulfatans]VGO17595.1 hypothetical protein PDESU_06193 [Pontiella desulfatans]
MSDTPAKEFDPTQNVDLGNNPVEAKKKEGAALLEKHGLANRFYFDPGNRGSYWHRTADGEWIGEPSREFEEMLCDVYNISTGRNDKDQSGARLSESKQVARYVKSYCRVDYVGRLAGQVAGFQKNNSQRVLVTHTADIMQPDPEQACPTLLELFENIFGDRDGEQLNQIEHFFAWWQHALKVLHSRRGGNGQNGLAIVLAGGTGCGKTLTTKLIRETFGGRECKPFSFMIGLERFNKECKESEAWIIDDEQSAIDAKSRSAFSASIKAVVADPAYRVRAIQKDGEVLEFFRRLVICTNLEDDRLQSLPSIKNDIADKISLFLCHSKPMPMSADTKEEQDLFRDTLFEELPGFVNWLLNVWEPKDKSVLGGRFGVRHYHHPDLCRDLFEVSKDQILWDHIQKVLFRSDDEFANWWWDGSTTKLRELLVSDESPLSKAERGYVPQSNHLGRSISTISNQFPEQLWKHQVEGKDRWLIVKPGKTVAEYRELQNVNRSYKT